MLADTIVGMIEASIDPETGDAVNPQRFRVDHRFGSRPIAQVPTGWNSVPTRSLMKASRAPSLSTSGPGSISASRCGAKGLCFMILPGEPEAGTQHVHAAVAAEEIVEDRRLIGRVGAFQRHATNAARPQLADMHEKAVAGETGGGLRVGAAGAEEELYVGPVALRVGRNEPAALGGRGRKQPALAEHPVKDVQDIAWKRLPGNAVRRGGFGAIFQRHVEVILQVLADTGQIVHQRDAVSGKVARLADA